MVEEQGEQLQTKTPESNNQTGRDQQPEDPSTSVDFSTESAESTETSTPFYNVESTETTVNAAQQEVVHKEKRIAEDFQKLAESAPEILQANSDEFEETVVKAGVEKGGLTAEEARQRYQQMKEEHTEAGGIIAAWFKKKIKNSSFSEFIDWIFSANSTGGSSGNQEIMSNNENNSVDKNEFLRELKYPRSFAEALSRAYNQGPDSLKTLNKFYLKTENLNAAMQGSREALGNVIKELHQNFSSATGQENWRQFSRVFAQELYPGRNNPILSENIRNLIADIAKNDSLDTYLGKEDQSKTKENQDQDETEAKSQSPTNS